MSQLEHSIFARALRQLRMKRAGLLCSVAGVLLAFGVAAYAQPAEAPAAPAPRASAPQGNANIPKVKSLAASPGEPVIVTFEDGREIGFKIVNVFDPLRARLTLSENSCSGRKGDQTEFVVPLIYRSLIAYWRVHPHKRGEPVMLLEERDSAPRVYSFTGFITREHGTRFAEVAGDLRSKEIADPTAYRELARVTAPFWLSCRGECRRGLLPAGVPIEFWDENFETQNSELQMSSWSIAPTVNQTVTRRLRVATLARGSRIELGQPHRAHGMMLLYNPPGIAYQFLWHFRARNFAVPEDPFCQMKWDIDFSHVFTQITRRLAQVQETSRVRIENEREYAFDPGDLLNLSLSNAFRNGEFESSRLIP